MKNRVAEVNAELKRLGFAERLKAGKDYYYFTKGEAHTWPTSAVMVYRSSELTVEQWVAEYLKLKEDWMKTR